MKPSCFVSLLVIFACTGSVFAGTWNAAANFNSSSNPDASSVFSYGVGSGGASFTALSPNTPPTSASPFVLLSSSTSFCCTTTNIAWNGTGSMQNYYSIYLPANEIALDPQQTAGAILRFTSPAAGSYSVSGKFEGVDQYQVGTNWAIFSGTSGSSLANGSIATGGFHSTSPFSLTVSLSAGQNLDFVVTTTGPCCFLSTGLDLTVSDGASATPEPSTLLLCVTGFAVALERRYRRK